MYQIVTDSCCDLPYTVLKEIDVDFLPMIVQIDGKEYPDDLGKTFDYAGFLKQIQEGGLPTTSQINVGRYLEFFTPYVEKKIPLIYLAFSSGMSGSYSSALQAVEMLKEDGHDPDIHVVDTLAASLGQGQLVITAAGLRDQGKSLDELITIIEEIKMKLQSWVTVDDLDHLQRGGRISKVAASLGGLVNIKPIIHVDAEGKLQSVSKARGRSKALSAIVEETASRIGEDAGNQVLLIAYAGDKPAAEKVQALLDERVHPKEIRLYPLGPTITSHTGYGCIAIFSFGETRK